MGLHGPGGGAGAPVQREGRRFQVQGGAGRSGALGGQNLGGVQMFLVE